MRCSLCAGPCPSLSALCWLATDRPSLRNDKDDDAAPWLKRVEQEGAFGAVTSRDGLDTHSQREPSLNARRRRTRDSVPMSEVRARTETVDWTAQGSRTHDLSRV